MNQIAWTPFGESTHLGQLYLAEDGADMRVMLTTDGVSSEDVIEGGIAMSISFFEFTLNIKKAKLHYKNCEKMSLEAEERHRFKLDESRRKRVAELEKQRAIENPKPEKKRQEPEIEIPNPITRKRRRLAFVRFDGINGSVSMTINGYRRCAAIPMLATMGEVERASHIRIVASQLKSDLVRDGAFKRRCDRIRPCRHHTKGIASEILYHGSRFYAGEY